MNKPLPLSLFKTISIKPTKPFAFDSTFHKPDHFTSGDNEWEPGTRWQTWNWEGTPLGLKFIDAGTAEDPKVDVEVYTDSKPTDDSIRRLTDEISYLYNLHLDLSNFYNTFDDHPVLGPVIKRWKGMRPGHPSPLYNYLIIGIVLQNATVRRSMQMFQALLENYGALLEFDGKQLWTFWSPGKLRAVTEQELRDLKVGYRAKFIKKIDEQFSEGHIDEQVLRKAELKTQRDTLLNFYGIGPATVWYILFDVFHNWDHFDHISPWEQKIYSKLFLDRDPENPASVSELLHYIDQFKPYRQLAVHYIWEDLWWKRKNGLIPWLEKLIRV